MGYGISSLMPSFDIVSKVDQQELDNALNQTRKESLQRYDLRSAGCLITADDTEVKLVAVDDYKLKALLDIFKSKLVRRGISIKAFAEQKSEPTTEGKQKQILRIQQGIPSDKAKSIVKSIKELKLKIQSQIQGDQVRISGKKIDDLQSIIQMLQANDHGIHMDFVNMKS